MNAINHFVEGGGWVDRQIMGRPKTQFCGFLSLIWCPISLIGLHPFLEMSGNGVFIFDNEMLLGLLILPHPVFIGLILFFLLTEKPRKMIGRTGNPDYDLRKLY